ILSGNSSGTWSTTTTTPTITVTTSGNYSVVNTNTCGSVTSNHIIVTVNPLPTATTGSNDTICSGANVTLGVASIAGHTYSWTPTAGLSSATIANPLATPTGTTTYALTETITATGCQKTNSVTVTVNPLPTATTGANAAICNGSNVTLGAASVAGHTYSWTPTAGLSSATMANPLASPTATTTYILTETITATGCQKTNSVTVTVSPTPVASVITAGSAITLCAGGNVILSGNSNATWSTTATTPTITVTTSGDYSVVNTNACGSVTSNHIIVTVNPLPTATTGANAAICNGSNVTLGAASVAGHTYSWTPTAGLSSATMANPLASPTATTTYTLTETITATGCQKTNSVTVTVSPAPVASVITAGSAITLCAGGNVILSGNSNGTWSTTATTPTITVTTSGDYSVVNTNACGSVTSNHIVVTVNPLPTATTGAN